jgi:hypothetical protein
MRSRKAGGTATVPGSRLKRKFKVPGSTFQVEKEVPGSKFQVPG